MIVPFVDISKTMKSKKYHTIGTIPKSHVKIVERGKIEENSEITDHNCFNFPLIMSTI